MLRIPSGIPGLDELIEGGFPESANILIAGGAGSGKSIFSLQYIYNGAKLYKQPGLYVTLEESIQNIWWITQRFKWDLLPLEKAGALKILKFEPGEDFANRIRESIAEVVTRAREMAAKRVAIDSVTAFSYWLPTIPKMREALYILIDELRKANCTSLLTCETSGGKIVLSHFGFEEFLTDGVVQLFFMPPHRALFIRKMRATAQSKAVHPFEIREDGIVVNPREQVLWEAIKE